MLLRASCRPAVSSFCRRFKFILRFSSIFIRQVITHQPVIFNIWSATAFYTPSGFLAGSLQWESAKSEFPVPRQLEFPARFANALSVSETVHPEHTFDLPFPRADMWPILSKTD